MKIGCHVSIAGGVYNAPGRAAELGCETFQIFTRSPQGGKAPELTDSILKNFREEMEKHELDDFVVHTPYYINFGSLKNNIFYGSVSVVKDELNRANELGAKYVMTHLGTFKDCGIAKGEEMVIKGLSKVLEGYQGKTRLLIEISAGSGDVAGSSIEQLGLFVDALKGHKGFGGVCWDTQHAFASGYEMHAQAGVKKTFNLFEKEIGLKYLAMSHMNDSKIELGGRRDRHDHIGEGHIGAEGFGHILKFFAGLEKKNKREMLLILETEHDKVRADIQKLKEIRTWP